ncbi:MAG: DUF4288 domain-containing protein [Fimbriimonadales bacterium]
MWYTARILIRVRKIHPTLPEEGIGWSHPLIPEKLVAKFESTLEAELGRVHLPKLAQIKSLCAKFPSYLQSRGLKHIGELEPSHILDFLDYVKQTCRPPLYQRYLRAIALALSVFLNDSDRSWIESVDKELRWLGAWYEEMLVLFEAENEEQATQRAEAWARELVAKHQANANPDVQWELVDVLDVYEVLDSEIGFGTELYSRYLSESEVPRRYRTPTQLIRR